jgi:ParB family chromosome partitioning protein
MPCVQARARRARDTILYLPLDEIAPSPVQPRKKFAAEGLQELSESISRYGILNPLTVRRKGDHYELVAGERRLRAAQLAGLDEVPCIVFDIDMEESGLIALVENLQRRDLDFIEEAEGLERLIRLFGLSQEECARRIGKSQSAVANKLRLLKLPSDVLEGLRDGGLTERHGRALLRLQEAEAQRAALSRFLRENMTVAVAEAYVDRLLTKPPPAGEAHRTLFVLKDVRVFLNTLNHGLEIMRKGGIEADLEKQETEDRLILTVSIPKHSLKKYRG